MIVWIASVAFVVAAALAFHRLDRTVHDLRREGAALDERIKSVSADRASLYTSLLLLRNSANGYSHHVATINRVLAGHCDRNFTQRCVRWLHYGELLNFHEETLLVRIAARTPRDFAEMLRRYTRYESYIDAVQWHRAQDRMHWFANTNEGIAYALWRAGDARRALRFIDKAHEQNAQSGVVGLTYLKVSCANKAPAAVVRARYAAITSTLQTRARVQSPDDLADAENARFNADIFANDAELFTTCAYAKLPNIVRSE